MFILFIIPCFLVYTIHDGLSNFSNMSIFTQQSN